MAQSTVHRYDVISHSPALLHTLFQVSAWAAPADPLGRGVSPSISPLENTVSLLLVANCLPRPVFKSQDTRVYCFIC